ncbi:MAG: nitroreductase family protein [Coriobacteriia bacterium]|nr:nitroreductase family protein [Coriobacteriia bacterium]
MDAIYARTSVRQFTDQDLTEAEIEKLLRAAMAAPSAGNQQPWEFYVVRDADARQQLSQASPYAKPAGAAPVVVVVCQRTEGLRFRECAPQDLSAAVENLLLEAAHMGLGAVWMGVAPEQDRMDNVAAAVKMPSGLEAFALVAVGHPAAKPQPKCAGYYDESRIHQL